MIELTPEEEKMIIAFRRAREIPINVTLWYIAGLRNNLNLIRGIEPDRDEEMEHRIKVINNVMSEEI